MSRSRIVLILGLFTGAVFLWLALRNVDAHGVVAALRRANLWWALPFLAALVGFCWAKAARWAILLEGIAATNGRTLLAPVVIGYAATTLMPMQLGEVVRAYAAARQLRTQVAPALASIALERLLDVVALVAMLGIVLAAGTSVGSALRQAGVWLLIGAVLSLSFLAFYASRPESFGRMIDLVCRPLPRPAQRFVVSQAMSFAGGLTVLRRPSRFAAIVTISSVQWACMYCCAWATLVAFDIQLPATAPLLLLVTTILGMSLPAGPGYIGTIQLAFWAALHPFGIDQQTAIATSIFYHSLLCGPLLLWGGVEALRLGIRPAAVRREQHEIARPVSDRQV